ncbi:hypothetical protein D3C87_1332730 [compost metagenome]
MHTFLLHVVEPIVVGLPDIQVRAGDRPASRIQHSSADQRRFTLAVQADVCAVFVVRRIGHVERAENCIGRGALGSAMVDRVDQHGRTQHVRQQDVFLTPVGAHLPGLSQELDGLEPFLVSRLDFLDGGMQMPGQYRHDFCQARVGVGRDSGIDDFGGVFLFEKAANGDVGVQVSSHDSRSLIVILEGRPASKVGHRPAQWQFSIRFDVDNRPFTAPAEALLHLLFDFFQGQALSLWQP